jgi:hypothetical protein
VVVSVITALTDIAVSFAVSGSQRTLLYHDLGAIVAGSAAYVALFTLVSLFVNKPMVPCLLFAFVWETAVPDMPGDLYRLSISGYLTSIAHRPTMEFKNGALDALAGLLGVNVISSTAAWAGMIGFTLFCLAFGAYWFRTFEYIAREDD